MNIKRLWLIMLLVTFNLGSCEKKVDPESQIAELLQVDREFAKASLEQGAAEAFKMNFDNEAIMMPSGGNPIRGLETIYQGMMGDFILKWEPQEGEVSKSGDLGYTWGKYEYIYENDKGDTVHSYGKYVNVWKKNKKGEWKVLVDIGNSSPAPTNPDENEG